MAATSLRWNRNGRTKTHHINALHGTLYVETGKKQQHCEFNGTNVKLTFSTTSATLLLELQHDILFEWLHSIWLDYWTFEIKVTRYLFNQSGHKQTHSLNHGECRIIDRCAEKDLRHNTKRWCRWTENIVDSITWDGWFCRWKWHDTIAACMLQRKHRISSNSFGSGDCLFSIIITTQWL